MGRIQQVRTLEGRCASKKLKERLKHKYALSDQGVNDMIKGFVSVTISDLVLMLPVGMLYFLIRDYLQGNLSGRGWFYGVGIVVCLALVADADKIVVLKDGVVAETGTPEQLMKQQGIYQHMTQVQNEAAACKW